MKVLIIEDDLNIREVIQMTIEMRWPNAQIVSTHLGESGISLAEQEKPDILILDLGLPDRSGYDVLKEIRSFSNVAIIILTSRGDEADITKGLEWGADDYVVKPFRQMELLSRIQALIRRSTNAFSDQVLVRGNIRFNPETTQLFIGKREISLTKTESIILEKLMTNAGMIVTHSVLAEAVWGSDFPSSVESLRVYVRRLREKIEKNPKVPQMVITKPGTGYMFKDAA